ncbi:MAG: carbohydrate ABC transporter permease [Eubacteriales bacterium]|nr:carbohydrate ABC transporter permease [Eubacteriales bacterium]
MKTKKKLYTGTLVSRIILITYSVMTMIPFYIMVVNSFKSSEEFYNGIFALPKDFIGNTIINYGNAWKEAALGSGLINTVIVGAGATVITVVLSAMAAYELARRDFPFKKQVGGLYLLMLLVPSMVALTPTFFIGRTLGLYNKRLSLILFYSVHQLPFTVYTMKSFFMTIPHELEEAAYIDGATSVRTFYSVMLPVMRPGFVTAAIFAILEFFDEYLYAIQLVVKKDLLPAAVTILRYRAGQAVRQIWGETFAACMVLTVPIVIIYALFQEKIMGGMTAGSVKG